MIPDPTGIPWASEEPTGPQPPTQKARDAAMLGARLQTLRISADLTDEDLARLAGMDLQAYQALEAGDPDARQLLTTDTLHLLADHLSTTPGHLLREPDDIDPAEAPALVTGDEIPDAPATASAGSSVTERETSRCI